MTLAHKIRLVPTKTQEAYFRRACGATRFTFNWALAEWKRLYAEGEKPSGLSLKVRFNAIRREQFPWTYDVHRDATSDAFSRLQAAFNAFFKGKAKYPTFKKKGQHDSFYIANDKLRLDGRKVRLPVLGWVRLREALRFEGKILGATVSREANRWHLSVQVDVGDYRQERTGNGTVGVDLGVTTLATLSTGEKIEGPKALRGALKRLQRLSRQHSRKVKGSKNRRKSAGRLARLHCRVADIRSNALHGLTTRLCRENQAVGIESLNVRGMLRNHHLALALSDAAFGEFRRQLTYKAIIYETEVREADRWFPSSKTCSVCGHVVDSMPLSVREWTCPKCGVVHDRDVNAASNLDPGKLPRVTGEVTPVDRKALVRTRKRADETGLVEAGTSEGAHLCAPSG